MNIKLIGITLVAVLILGITAALLFWRTQTQVAPATTFEECAARGYPIMESYPEQCRTPEGLVFVRQIKQEGEVIEVTGEIICLPYRDENSPHTLECAIGIKDGNGDNYGIRYPDGRFFDLPTGSTQTINGSLESASGDSLNRYNIEGIIVVSE